MDRRRDRGIDREYSQTVVFYNWCKFKTSREMDEFV